MKFATTGELQRALIRTADRDTLVLTASGRLARRLRHLYTETQMAGAPKGWFTPSILTLNAWLADQWAATWPDKIPASYLKSLHLWEKAVVQAEAERPEGIESDLRLYKALDETYSSLIRHKIRHLPVSIHSPLFSWRNSVIKIFEDLLKSEGLISSAFLPELVSSRILNGQGRLPGRILMAGFDSPSPSEKELIDALNIENNAVSFCTELKNRPKINSVSLENIQKETTWLLEDLFQKSKTYPLHHLGVVVPAMQEYAPHFCSLLNTLTGRPADIDSGIYNISFGSSLLKEPLVQAGLLPLKFMIEGEKRQILTALLLSHYYGQWEPNRIQIAQLDRVWRRYSVDSGLDSLMKVLKAGSPELVSLLNESGRDLPENLALLSKRRLSAAGWTDILKDFWSRFRFPVINDEHEAVIHKKLQETLSEVASSFGPEKMDNRTFYTWVKLALDCGQINVHSYEQAGVQIVGLLEARCLSFDHLYIAGLSHGSIPQPVRHFPLLSREEKSFIQGATIESQYAFGRRIFEHLMTVSPEITLTRPLTDGDSPVPPSPFWPSDEEKADVNLWLEPGPLFMRAEWLIQGQAGWRKGGLSYPPQEIPIEPSLLPQTLSVSELDLALSCPFRFLLQCVLRICPLDEPAPGILPPDKGTRLHHVLALITRRVRHEGICLDRKEDIERIVQECIEEILSERVQVPDWQVEKKRWFYQETSAHIGLLGKWLEAEKARSKEGWKWLNEEVSFEGLGHSSWAFSLSGRIDRIDYRKEENEICCWDYKTGNTPGTKEITDQFLASQLPCYLLAVKAGRIKIPAPDPNLRAGYIKLKLEGEVQMMEPLAKSDLWSDCLSQWEEEIASFGMRFQSGWFPPEPRPSGSRSPCRICSYGVLCKYELRSPASEEE